MQPPPPSNDGFWSRSGGSNGSGHSPQGTESANMWQCIFAGQVTWLWRWNFEEQLPVAASFLIFFCVSAAI
jgi:hypothetical protein